MDKIIEKKINVDKAVHELLCVWTEIESSDNRSIDELNKKNGALNKANMKLIDELKQKDKIISIDKKTISDYEKQINSIHEVKEEENKFTMLKAKDKEVNNLNKTIKLLKKELDQVNSKLEILSTTNVTCEVQEVVNETEGTVEEPTVNEIKEPTVNEIKEPTVNEIKELTDDEESEESDDDPIYVTVIHRKKKYLVEKGNLNSKMYSILSDGDVGDEVGYLKDGKTKINKNKKK